MINTPHMRLCVIFATRPTICIASPPQIGELTVAMFLPGEVNGKSGNLNNAMKIIYKTRGHEGKLEADDVLAIFDCDQVCNKDFFVQTLPLLAESADVAMVRPCCSLPHIWPHSPVHIQTSLHLSLRERLHAHSSSLSSTCIQFLQQAVQSELLMSMQVRMDPRYTIRFHTHSLYARPVMHGSCPCIAADVSGAGLPCHAWAHGGAGAYAAAVRQCGRGI